MIAASEAVSICRKIHRTHHHFVIATRACSTTRGIEVPVPEHTIEDSIKHMPDRRRQLRHRHPYLLLPFSSTLTRSYLPHSIPEIKTTIALTHILPGQLVAVFQRAAKVRLKKHCI